AVQRARAIEEWLARQAQNVPKDRFVERVVAAIRKFLRKIGFTVEFSDAEIRQLLVKARDHVIDGKKKIKLFESGPEFQVDTGEQTEFDMATVEESDRIGTLDDPTMAGHLWDEFIFQAQDRFNYLSKEQMEAARVRRMAGMGEELPEDMDAYLAELRYHGMAGAAIDEFQEEFVQPLIDTVSENKLEIDEIDRFLHARHAEEANAQLKEINPDLEDNEALSGMTDDQAVQVLAEIRKSDKSEVYQKVADIVDSITKADRQNRVDYGLEKPQTVKKWEKTYKYYVPLMREGKGSKLPAKGKGYDIKGGQKRRAGSQRSVINVLAYAISQAESTIVRGEKNKVSTAL
ncbi:MAG: hypothetical protein KAR32_06280, partial [Candidatus Omnitrophica bacterium]|nr:hypothetical protein [Candidatus Omnitrophota bacterium]